MDFIGVTRAIDQAVYMLLNALAIILWRIDSAIIGMSFYSYATQDWLTGTGGGVWYIMDWLLNTSGLFGINTWTLFAGLALMLWGLSRIARPFIPTAPVHPGKLLVFFVISYIVISQGSSLMQDIESWRLDAGSAIYEGVAGSSSPTLSVPSIPATSDPLAAPANLDGVSPIRGWEAVASSYFLATSTGDLHQPYPPEAFRIAYCLYNPDEPIDLQTTTNAQGCSPQRAWDEWDVGDLSILEDVLGIDVDSVEETLEDFLGILLGDIDLELTAPVPTTLHHPENRELGIRQAQGGVARLALGTIVALFPIVEANISLMLALAASFIYLTLPIVLLFGFFLATEPMVNRLLMQFVYIIIRTLVINGIVALFLLLLMNTALSGSLTAYLGLVGVGLVGGIFLARVAAATMKETLTQAMGALGSVWLGTSTGLLGKAAAQPAQATLGVAKMGAAAALLGAGGAMSFLDLAETGYEGMRSGASDLRRGAPDTMQVVDRQAARLPASLNNLAQESLGTRVLPESTTGAEPKEKDADNDSPIAALATGLAAPVAAGLLRLPTSAETEAGDEVSPNSTGDGQQARWSDTPQASLAPTTASYLNPQRETEVEGWVSNLHQAQQSQRGVKQAGDKGRDLVGEELAWKVERAIGRHRPAETKAVLEAAKEVAKDHNRAELVQRGRLTPQAITAVRDKLEPDTARAFSGQTGTWDLAALTAMTVQRQTIAPPEKFRRAMANAKSGWGQDSPGRKVPHQLGLDPVAAGAHYTTMNRFARLSEAAGLSTEQRERLLAEAQKGQISDELRADIDASLKQQREKQPTLKVTTDDLVAGALAMPATLSGPEQVWTTPAAGEKPAKSTAERSTKKSTAPVEPPADPAIRQQTGRVEEGHTPARLAQPNAAREKPGVTPIDESPRGNVGQALKTSLQEQEPTSPDQGSRSKQEPVQTKDRQKPQRRPIAPDPPTQAVEPPDNTIPISPGAALPSTGRPQMDNQSIPLTASETDQPTFGKTLQDALQDQPPDQVETNVGQPAPAEEKRDARTERLNRPSISQTETGSSKPRSEPPDIAGSRPTPPMRPAATGAIAPPSSLAQSLKFPTAEPVREATRRPTRPTAPWLQPAADQEADQQEQSLQQDPEDEA